MGSSQRISALVSWATQNGASLHPSVEVYQDPQTGLSFRVKLDAQSATKPFESIVSLPTSLPLSFLNAQPGRDETKPFPQSFLEQTPPHAISRFFLVKQYLLGQDSFWWPYLQALPQPSQLSSWASPPFWPSDEAELLEGTNVEVGMEKIRGDVKKEFKTGLKLLKEAEWDSHLLQQLSLPLYQWAYCIFSSRSFRPSLVLSRAEQQKLPDGVKIDDFSVLLPLFDIGNHDMATEVRWELDEQRSTCDLKVNKAYQPGEQVFNNYSMKTNAELLLGYGFMIPATDELHNDYVHLRKRQSTPNTTEEYYISLRPINDASSLLARSKQTIQLSESTQIAGPFKHVQHDMVWDIFCTLVPADRRDRLVPVDSSLSGDEAEKARQELFFAGRVSEEGKLCFAQTASIIQHKVLQELERLDQTDVEIVGGGDLTENQKLALDYRARCRLILETTLVATDMDGLYSGIDEEG